MRRIVTVMVLAAALGLAACASKPVKPVSSQTATAGSGAASQGAGSGANAGEGSLGNQS